VKVEYASLVQEKETEKPHSRRKWLGEDSFCFTWATDKKWAAYGCFNCQCQIHCITAQ